MKHILNMPTRLTILVIHWLKAVILRCEANCVWLTTLEGLRTVDVILRRMDDAYCDPVELRDDSYLGVPGLTNAVRMGNVAISNILGSGVLENPALHASLPALSKHLLGEDLRIPSVPSWWCGNQQQREYVLANLHRMVIKPIHPNLGFRFIFGSDAEHGKQDELRRRINTRPYLFIGQETMSMSTVPVLAQGMDLNRVILFCAVSWSPMNTIIWRCRVG